MERAFTPARHPYYAAGLYYLQEPSAMTPASRLPVEPGERVLDLCAAPGGKATELAAKLKGEGLLVANDLSVSRARALLRNLELMGASNCFVTSETPARLAAAFPEYFHKILVDAPCSGEGMFRKDEDVAAAWSEEKVKSLRRRAETDPGKRRCHAEAGRNASVFYLHLCPRRKMRKTPAGFSAVFRNFL